MSYTDVVEALSPDAQLTAARGLINDMINRHNADFVDIARSSRISVRRVRAMARGRGVTCAADIRALVLLGAELDALAAAGIDDPGRWPYTPVVPGFSMTPSELTRDELLGLAGASDRLAFLDHYAPDWRDTAVAS